MNTNSRTSTEAPGAPARRGGSASNNTGREGRRDIDGFEQEVLALLRDPNGTLDDYLRLLRTAEQLDAKLQRAFLLSVIQEQFPRALERAVPNRAAKAQQAVEVLIQSVQKRLSLDENECANKPILGARMTTPIPHGVLGATMLSMFIEVVFAYANSEGYRATFSIEQEDPRFPVEYVVKYWYPNQGEMPILCREGTDRTDGSLWPPPSWLIGLFEHILGRVIAGQHLDGAAGNGAFYR